MVRVAHVVLGGGIFVAACTAMPSPYELRGRADADAGTATAPAFAVEPPELPLDGFSTLNGPEAAHAELCANDGMHPNFPNDADVVTKTFCQDLEPGGVAAAPRSLAELQAQLGLGFVDPHGENGKGGNPAFAILGHSSALTARKVTTIAPTAFVFTPPPADGSAPSSYVALGFDPGEPFAEIAAYDPTAKKVNFYLVIIDMPCRHAPNGCSTTDLLTPRLVSEWTGTFVYEDTTALGNTIFDCHVCHQPNDAGEPMLRMQEIDPPFTHWFSAQTDGGKALLADFHAAHGTSEDYGPIPAAMIDKSDPALLAALVKQAGFGAQPNAFRSAAIEAEVAAFAKGQPGVNVPRGWSATWDAAYEAAVSGQFIAAPYHDVKVTDPQKLARMTAAYQAFLSGAAHDVPDIRDTFLDDGLRDMGFAPKEGLGGRGMLAQMCQECHNANLDLGITREKFLVDELDTMSRAEKDLAIARIKADSNSRLRMPPPLFRTMTDDERQRMIDELAK